MPAIERPENAKPYTAATPRITNAVKITNQTDAAVEIWLNGEVGWDIVASELLPVLKANDGEGKTIILWTNSGGGDVFEGYMIGNYLPSLKATVVVRPLALIGSIMTYIGVKADRIEMPENSMFVIHEASAIVSGRSSDLRNHAEVMDKLNDQIASAYTAKRLAVLGSADGEDFRAMMATGDVWLTAREASALGLIDLITDAVEVTACVRPDLLDTLNAPADIRAARRPGRRRG